MMLPAIEDGGQQTLLAANAISCDSLVPASRAIATVLVFSYPLRANRRFADIRIGHEKRRRHGFYNCGVGQNVSIADPIIATDDCGEVAEVPRRAARMESLARTAAAFRRMWLCLSGRAETQGILTSRCWVGAMVGPDLPQYSGLERLRQKF